MNPTTHDSSLRRTIRTVLILALVLAAVGFALGGAQMGWSAGFGGLLAYANLVVLARSVARLLEGGNGSWAVVFLLKFAVLLAVTYVAISRGLVDPLGLALGFGALPLGVVIGGLLTAERPGGNPGSLHSPVAPAPSMERNPPPPVAKVD